MVKKYSKQYRGFTLIELMMVIAIIGLLSTIVFAAVQDSREAARDTQRVQTLKQIQNALELFRNANNGLYPCGFVGTTPNLLNLRVSIMDGASHPHAGIDACQNLRQFLPNPPQNPSPALAGTVGDYLYTPATMQAAAGTGGNRNSYTLTVQMESQVYPFTGNPNNQICSVSGGSGVGSTSWNGVGGGAYPPCY